MSRFLATESIIDAEDLEDDEMNVDDDDHIIKPSFPQISAVDAMVRYKNAPRLN